MEYVLRKARDNDVTEISSLIELSVQGLSRDDYSPRQIELSIKTVFGIDKDLIDDETYFVVETSGKIVGCGGWSKRKTLYGASTYEHSRTSGLLNPATEPAKIRAFFIHPDWARRGIGSAILDACEAEATASGFKSAEMMATLPGVKLYAVRGYEGDERVAIPVGEGEEITCIRMRKSLI
jgi:N-acetylglutamate synthase-like GNAT family acetyltransferase